MKKNIYLLLLLTIQAVTVFSQTSPQFSLQNYELQTINPAVLGSKLSHVIQLHHRSQWTGFEGAPNTQLLSYSGIITKEMGLGAYIFHDVTGPTKNYGFNIGYAYHLLFEKFNLSFGISGTVSQYHFNGNDIDFQIDNDPLISQSIMKSKLIPDASAGAFAYNQKFYLGVSAGYLIESQMKEGLQSTIPSVLKYYTIAGYNWQLRKNINLIPNLVLTGYQGFKPKIDVGVRAEIMNSFVSGVNFRSKDALSIMMGIRLQKQFFIAYSYDAVLSNLKNYSGGSHEILCAISIFSDKQNKTMFHKSDSPVRRSYWE